MVGLGEAARAQRSCSSVFQRTAARSGLGFRIVLTYVLGVPKRVARSKKFRAALLQMLNDLSRRRSVDGKKTFLPTRASSGCQ